MAASSIPIDTGLSGPAVGTATALALAIPVLASIGPIRAALRATIRDALDVDRPKATAVKFSVERAGSGAVQWPLVAVGLVTFSFGLGIYVVLPLSLLSLNLTLFFNLFLAILVGLIGGLVVLALNAELLVRKGGEARWLTFIVCLLVLGVPAQGLVVFARRPSAPPPQVLRTCATLFVYPWEGTAVFTLLWANVSAGHRRCVTSDLALQRYAPAPTPSPRACALAAATARPSSCTPSPSPSSSSSLSQRRVRFRARPTRRRWAAAASSARPCSKLHACTLVSRPRQALQGAPIAVYPQSLTLGTGNGQGAVPDAPDYPTLSRVEAAVRRWTAGDAAARDGAFLSGWAWVTAPLSAGVAHLMQTSALAWRSAGQLSPPASAAAQAASAVNGTTQAAAAANTSAGTLASTLASTQVFLQGLGVANLGKQTSWGLAITGVSPSFVSAPASYSGFLTVTQSPPSTDDGRDVFSRLYSAAGSQQVGGGEGFRTTADRRYPRLSRSDCSWQRRR